jgi:tRNA A-37 threonylcarbamoyl transferase component Bud32
MQFKRQSVEINRVVLRADLNTIIDKRESFFLKKHDFSTTVGILKGSDFGLSRDLLVKRFNYRGFFDFVLHKLFNSRAKRLWKTSLRLYREGLSVPEPVAYEEASFQQRNSFFFSSVIEDAESLWSLYRKGFLGEESGLLERLAGTIAEWHLRGAVHGDLKWPNILVQSTGEGYRFFLIDLDQARLYSAPSVRGIINDLKRFYRFGLEAEAADWVEKVFFPAYLSFIPEKIKARINSDEIKQKAKEEWIKKGSKRLL